VRISISEKIKAGVIGLGAMGIAAAVCETLTLSEKLNQPSKRLLSVVGAGAAD
jgi:hypothetical protein